MEKPANAKIKSDGIMTFFHPNLSAIMPATGVKDIHGKVKALINSPPCVLLRPNNSEIFGKAEVKVATPIFAIMA